MVLFEMGLGLSCFEGSHFEEAEVELPVDEAHPVDHAACEIL
jgi:hypothetical protein